MRMPRMSVLLPLLVGLGSSTAAAAGPLELGKAAPNFSLRDREGALVSLSDLAYPLPERPGRPRRVVLLDFFRTDCKPCRKALPRLLELHKKLAGQPVTIILMALLEEDEGEAKLDRFLKQQAVPFLVLVDAYGAAAKKYIASKGGFQIPSLFLIDKGGTLRQRLVGGEAESLPKLTRQIEALLK